MFEGPPGEFDVVGIAGYGDADSLGGATWALFDLPTAQRVLGKEGELDSVSVVADQGVSGVDLQRRIGEVLPKGVEAVTAATVTSEAQDQISTGLGFLRTAFLVFAFVALFVGAFIIFNTFAIIVAQRTRELALFRALGASGRQVMTSVMVEATVIGVVSSLLGVLAGIGIAILLKGALSATGLEIPSSGTVILGRTFVVSIVVGTLVTVIAALVPARRAARVAPIEALREAQDRPGRSLRFRLISGLIVLALGIVPLVYGLFGAPGNALQLVGLGVALTFVGVAMLTPLIARPIAGAIGLPIRKTGVPGKLGGENSMRNPRRTAATASALMIGLGLVVFVAVFGASAKASTTEVLDRTLKADFILTSPTLTGFSTAAAEDLRGIQGVETVSQVRQGEVHIKDGTSFVTGLDPTTFPEVSELGVNDGSLDELQGANTIAVFDDTAADNGWSVGDTITVEFPATGKVDLEVVALYSENGLIGDYAISLDTFDANVAQQLDLFVLVKAAEGADLSAVRADIETALTPYPNVEVLDQAQFRDKYATFINQILNLVTALLLFAVIIALFGVMNTLYLSIYERTRELGLLRAVGPDPAADALDGPVGGRDHLDHGSPARRRDRDRLRVGPAAGARAQGVHRARDPGRSARVLRRVRRRCSGWCSRSSPPGGRPSSTCSTRSRTSSRRRGGRISWPPMPRLELPDGTTTELPEGEPVGSVLPPEAIAARVDGELVDLSFVPVTDGKVEPIAARPTPTVSTSCGIRPPTSWRRPCATCGRAPATRSARRSRTASTTTSSCRVRSPRPTSRRSRTACARSSTPTSRSCARRSRAPRRSSGSRTSPTSARSSSRSRRARSPPATRSRSTATTAGRTCAWVRTCPRPAGSARSS